MPNDSLKALQAEKQVIAAERRLNRRIALIIAIVLLSVAMLCLLSGRYSCSVWEVCKAFFHGILDGLISLMEIPGRLLSFNGAIANPIPVTWDSNVETVIWTIRVPRILTVIFVGGGLAVSGASYQCLFRNPLVSESILGVSSGASFGASIGILLALNAGLTTAFAFWGGISAVFLTYLSSKIMRGNQTLLLVLAGSVISSIFSAGLSIVKYIAPVDTALPEITFWLMGSFAKSSAKSLYLLIPVIAVCMVLLLQLRWQMNALALGDEEARTLGIHVRRARFLIIVSSTLITAVSVCVCGMVGWVGVIIPQITRMLAGPNARRLVPCAFFVGAVFLMIVDLACRTILVAEIPVGIVTSLVGAPIFMIMLKRSREGWL